jgi:hypothetical protein
MGYEPITLPLRHSADEIRLLIRFYSPGIRNPEFLLTPDRGDESGFNRFGEKCLSVVSRTGPCPLQKVESCAFIRPCCRARAVFRGELRRLASESRCLAACFHRGRGWDPGSSGPVGRTGGSFSLGGGRADALHAEDSAGLDPGPSLHSRQPNLWRCARPVCVWAGGCISSLSSLPRWPPLALQGDPMCGRVDAFPPSLLCLDPPLALQGWLAHTLSLVRVGCCGGNLPSHLWSSRAD